MTTLREARLQRALAEAALDHESRVHQGINQHALNNPESRCWADILAHPAVVAALAESSPAPGLRERIESLTVYRYILPTDDETTPTRTHRPFDMLKRNDVLAALAATPTASPTEPNDETLSHPHLVQAGSQPQGAMLDIDGLREAARRAGLSDDVTVADIENLAREYAATPTGTAEPDPYQRGYADGRQAERDATTRPETFLATTDREASEG